MKQSITLVKLLLQKGSLAPENMQPLLFADGFENGAEISINELKVKFEDLGVGKKS